jgi:hypothetical protein
MKLPRLIAIHYGLAAILLSASLAVHADSKKDLIEFQQKTSQEELDAAQKAKPSVENRPAVTTKKTLIPSKMDNTVSPAADLKDQMIEYQQKVTQEEIDAAQKAKPSIETRPAVVTKKTSKKPVTDSKDALIESQTSEAAKAIKDAAAAKPAVEGRPAVTTKKTMHATDAGS